MPIRSVEIPGENWVTQSSHTVTMILGERVPLAVQMTTFATLQGGEVAYIQVPAKSVGMVHTLGDKVGLFLHDNGYYLSRHDKKRKRVDVITLTSHPPATASDIARGVRNAMANAATNQSEQPGAPYTLVGFPMYDGASDGHYLTASPRQSRPRRVRRASKRAGYFLYDGPYGDDDYPTSSNISLAKPPGTKGRASAMMELPTGEQIEMQNVKFFEAALAPRMEVPDSQTQATTLVASFEQRVESPVAIEQGISNAFIASSAVAIPETMSQENANMNVISTDDLELHMEQQSVTNEDKAESVRQVSSFVENAAIDPQAEKEAENITEMDHDAELKSLELIHEDDHAEPEATHTDGEPDIEAARQLTPDKSTRLRRPTKKILRSLPRKNGSVDWSQDLRVAPEELRANILKSKKKPKKQALRNLRDVKVSTLKARGKAKKPFTKSKLVRPISKTIASGPRLRRVAAEKAKERLALVVSSEDESVAYDPEDPIKSSSVIGPDIEVVATEYRDKEVALDQEDDSNDDEDEHHSEEIKSPETEMQDVESGLDSIAMADADDVQHMNENHTPQEATPFIKDNPEATLSNSNPPYEGEAAPEPTTSIPKEHAHMHDDPTTPTKLVDAQVSRRANNKDDGLKHRSVSPVDSGIFITNAGSAEMTEVSTTYAGSQSTPMRLSASSLLPSTPCPKGRKRSRSMSNSSGLDTVENSPSATWKKALRKSQKTTLDILVDTSHVSTFSYPIYDCKLTHILDSASSRPWWTKNARSRSFL